MRLLALLVAAHAASAASGAEPPPAVAHAPAQPKPGVPVLVTARLAPGTAKAVLRVQAVAPGKYVRKSDPAYEKDWVDLPMRDDGTDGDARAGDGEFSVRVPAS
ncbi:MAG TPA: choice-of-anchor X domain-containing protein, partial [Urbifossiella sp.]|nr:choice-of-anchor X domain-containing protein [Urbifossiella sp.]